ncbi:MAG: threonine--tRNA ligase [Candidatus Omnitrophica bacterium]|nr:threonine--tRNA ligase [Candidatus Omnitrophota bacterium]
MDLETLRHSCAHIMAQAVKELWPETRLAIGPAIEDGFYYDFDRPEQFSEEDLLTIEERMHQIIQRDEPFIRKELSKKEAEELFQGMQETYKLELLKEIPDDKVSVYYTGKSFVDLCRGPHILSTGQIKAFKLLSLAGAYWRGNENNPMLQRIYGTCFLSQQELEAYLRDFEERKQRDHRKLGPNLELFDIYQQEAGAGLVFYHPKGALLRKIIEDYEKQEHLKRGYELVVTPHIMQADLWKTSGHYQYYRQNMYTLQIENKEFVLKPMNCPGHILIYKSKVRSWRDLPIRYFELGTVYRHEKAGVMHGLLRVRGFTQDDAHIFCLPSQLQEEIRSVIEFVFETMKVFGFNDIEIELSTRPEKSIGSDEDWQLATASLENSLKQLELKYKINPGEGAFYGPKIDIKLKDALKRSWQCATVQCDFSLPKRFNLEYIDTDGTAKQPIMLHRVILGSIERFIACLVEHYKGDFPLWLAPEQVRIIPIAEETFTYAQQVCKFLQASGIRTHCDLRNQTLNKRIRQAELDKIKYILIIGNKEIQQKVVTIRRRGIKEQITQTPEQFLTHLQTEIASRR